MPDLQMHMHVDTQLCWIVVFGPRFLLYGLKLERNFLSSNLCFEYMLTCGRTLPDTRNMLVMHISM